MWRNSSEAARSAGGLVVVAVDSGKNSHQALKWASDNLIAKGQIFHILHVRRKPTTLPTPTGQQLSLAEVNEDVATTYLNQLDIQTKELLLPFQCFCSRRGLCCKEIILDHTEVSRAIIDYIIDQSVDNLVLGASSRNAFARTFKQADVPTSVSKLAPDFCSIYVVAKGKLASIRPALRANKITVDKSSLVTSKATVNPFQTAKSDPVAQRSNELQTSPSASPTGVFGQGQSPCAGFVDLSYQSVNSCPSPTRNSTHSFDHPFNEVPDGGSQLTKTNSALDRNSYLDEYSIPVCPEEDLYEEFRRLKLIMKLRREMQNIVDPAHAVARDFYAWTAGEHNKGEKLGGALEEGRDPFVKSGVDVVTDRNLKFLNVVPSNVKFRRYTVEEIKKATDDFSDLLKIGEGGYGPVFLSNIDHSLAAIKVLRCDAQHGMKQFQQEVEVLSEIRHPNMVILMGACPENGCLVYEYMCNGSLEDRLACQNYTHPLSWELRFKIAAEIATGLLFLHKRKPEPLVHRDLKPANILLDQNFVCKISDVGLARLIPPAAVDAVTQYRMTAAAGTFCYIDPEYQKTGLVSIKSDIYALGIILLQLITAKPPMGLAHNMERAIKLGKFREMLDPSVQHWPMEETLEFGKLALKCAELRRKDRPDLATVVLPVLNRLKVLAEERQCNVWKLQHANTCYHQMELQDVSFSSGSSSTSISDL